MSKFRDLLHELRPNVPDWDGKVDAALNEFNAIIEKKLAGAGVAPVVPGTAEFSAAQEAAAIQDRAREQADARERAEQGPAATATPAPQVVPVAAPPAGATSHNV